jgi:hypothetical protein
MSWLLPVMLVAVVSLLMAAAHFLFVRWWARAADPARGDAEEEESLPRDEQAR